MKREPQVHYVCPNGCPVGVWLPANAKPAGPHKCPNKPHPRFADVKRPGYVALIPEPQEAPQLTLQ